jgi:hypothetical protein
VLWSLLGPQYPGDVAAVANFLFRCVKGSVTLSLELPTDLTVQRVLVGFDRQQAPCDS